MHPSGDKRIGHSDIWNRIMKINISVGSPNNQRRLIISYERKNSEGFENVDHTLKNKR